MLPSARAGSLVGVTPPQAAAAIAAVSAARGRGLVSSTSGGSQISASPRATSPKRRRPLSVSGRSSSATPSVPEGTAMA